MRNLKAVDLFAGAGGFSTGARMAGLDVVWAANHWPVAVEYHAENHPETVHSCQDLHQANWSHVPAHDVLLASPCCQGHSNARGKERPQHDESRSTAWAVVSCAEFHRSPFVVVENVAEFLTWNLYPAWKKAMHLLGYTLTENILNAADFGVPQSRQRLFIVATLDGELKIANPNKKHVAAQTIIDWRSGAWSLINKPGRAKGTLDQIRAGREIYGDKFLIAYYGSETNGRDLMKPLGTVTTKARHALINGDKMRMLTVDELKRAQSFPDSYRLPAVKKTAIHLIGNSVPPVMAQGVLQQIRGAA